MARRARARRAANGNGNRTPARRYAQRRNQRSNGRSKSSNLLANTGLSAVGNAFGSKGKASHLAGWDAFNPTHLPLPRVTGPYVVVRTTKLFSTTDQYIQFGTHMTGHDLGGGHEREWSNVIGFSGNSSVTPGSDNLNMWTVPMPGTGDSVTATPAALSLQIMNPEALQTTTGIVAAGSYKTQVDIGLIGASDTSKTLGDMGDDFVSFQAPRLMSAGKLALKGVQCNSYPLNMSELANFTPVHEDSDQPHALYNRGYTSVGFVPIGIRNTNSIDLQFLVTMEWRVRFDPSNPACAAHRFHGHSSDVAYDACVRHRAAMGHGVHDISDAVARMGNPRGKTFITE